MKRVFVLLAAVLLILMPILHAGARAVTSAGLGLSLSEMTAKYGSPERLQSLVYFKDRTISWDNNTRMEYSYQNADRTATLLEARRAAKRFIPTDAKLIREETQSSPYPRTIAYFRSAWLAKKVTSKYAWGSAKPGTFMVIYRHADGPVTSFVAACGDNP